MNKPLVVVGASIIALSVLGSVGYMWTNVSEVWSRQIRVKSPGSSTVTLRESGEHAIFYEFTGHTQTVRQHITMPELECTLVEKPGGKAIPIAPAPSPNKYQVGATQGVQLLTFTASAGDHVLTCKHDWPEPIDLLVGKGVMGELFGVMGPAVLVMLLLTALGVLLVVKGARR